MNKDDVLKLVQDEVKKATSLIHWKITDTPSDAYSVVNRGYLNANGSVIGRPKSSVATIGQPFFANDTKIPMVFDGHDWRNGVGSIVALGN